MTMAENEINAQINDTKYKMSDKCEWNTVNKNTLNKTEIKSAIKNENPMINTKQ